MLVICSLCGYSYEVEYAPVFEYCPEAWLCEACDAVKGLFFDPAE